MSKTNTIKTSVKITSFFNALTADDIERNRLTKAHETAMKILEKEQGARTSIERIDRQSGVTPAKRGAGETQVCH